MSMTEKGREIYLAYVAIILGAVLAYFGIIAGDQWLQLAMYYGGGTTATRFLYKLIKNNNGNKMNGKVIESAGGV